MKKLKNIDIESYKSFLALLSKPIWKELSDFSNKINTFVDEFFSIYNCDSIIIWKLDNKKLILKKFYAAGDAKNVSVDMNVGQGAAGILVRDSRIVIISNLLDKDELKKYGIENLNNEKMVRSKGWITGLFIPLDVGPENIGIVAFLKKEHRVFSEIEVNIAQAFSQRICCEFLLFEYIQKINEITAKVNKEAPSIEAGMIAIENAHDMDTYICMAQSNLSVISSETKHSWHKIYKNSLESSEHIDSVHKIIGEITRIANPKKLKISKIDLKDFLDEIYRIIVQHANPKKISVNKLCPESVFIKFNKEQLKRIFLNLYSNSQYFLETDIKGGRKKITIFILKDKEFAIIRFFDNGPGIPKENIENIFDYFYTTKGQRGMGFGLAITKRILTMHNGSIEVKSNWGYDTEFIIKIPLVKD